MYASFGAHHENLNGDRPMGAVCDKDDPMTLVSGNVRFMQIFEVVPWKGASNDSLWSKVSDIYTRLLDL